MRYVLAVLMLFSVLFAQISTPVEVAPGLDDKIYTCQRSYKIINDDVYITFRSLNNIYFTKITANNQQTTTLVYNLNIDHSYYLKPSIEVMDNGNIIIVFSNQIEEEPGFLYRALSTDGGETFEVESYQFDTVGTPYVVKRTNSVDLCFETHGELATKPLSEFNHFSLIEKTENEDGGINSSLAVFRGQDSFLGPVHSNDDIWIQNVGGWPTFYDMVTTSNRIMDVATGQPAVNSVPMDQIFLGGYEENIEPYSVFYDASISNGIELGDPNTDIVYVEMDGSMFSSFYGEIIEVGVQNFDDYSWYPHNAETANAAVNAGNNWFEDADIVHENEVTIYDTIWTAGPNLPLDDQNFRIPNGELWIKGEVSGNTFFGCADTVYIVGDITYEGTLVGTAPDGFSGFDPVTGEPQYDEPVNENDYFGLFSEKRIYIKYKHKDPISGEIVDDNCDGNVFLYGAYSAPVLADSLVYGEMACHYDGIFSFEYQHPHGSTPNFTALSPYTLEDTVYTFVDLHRYVFPINDNLPPGIEGFNLHGGAPLGYGSCGFPYEDPAYINSYPNNDPENYVYPYGTDYPWYNPVWPESSEDISYERGILHIFGSISQARRGFIHRSGSDPYNHPQGYVSPSPWEMDLYHYDGSHPSTGYGKDYLYDRRFKDKAITNFPFAVQSPEITREIIVMHSDDSGVSFEESYTEIVEETIDDVWMDTDGEKLLIAYYSEVGDEVFHFLVSDENPQEFTHYVSYNLGSALKNAYIVGDTIFANVIDHNTEAIVKYDLNDIYPDILQVYEPSFHLADFTINEDDVFGYVQDNFVGSINLNLDYYYDNEDGLLMGLQNWQHNFGEFSHIDSKVSIQLDDNEDVYSTLLIDREQNNHSEGELYLISGELEGIVKTPQTETVPITQQLTIYPNPFNLAAAGRSPFTTITFSSPEVSQNKDIEVVIYNVKGQKVKVLRLNEHYPNNTEVAGEKKYSAVWNGTDKNSSALSSGVYLFQLSIDNKIRKVKKGLLLK